MNLDFDELQNNSEITETDISKLEQSCFIDLSEEMPHPEILLSIGQHEYKGKFYPTPVMTAGEFSAIVATSKSKKTFLKSAFLASYIGGKTSILFPNIVSHRDKEYTILDFDTEQGKYYTQRTFRRVIEMVGASTENYKGYATRHLSSRERLLLIDYCLKNQQRYKHPVKMVAIDGIADLVENTNDILMSKEASDYIMKWTYEYNIHVTTVIHKSTTTNKPLGHLGTYVLKKAETVIDLDIQGDKTIKVTNPFSRGYRFDEFTFDVNKDALPYLINDFL
jgi:hypothetical protein